ncbi:hypothetical protein D3C80_1447630 [compost metagenome]
MFHIGRQVAIDDKTHRHLDPLAGLQHLLAEAETFGLVEVGRRLGGRNTRDRLCRHRMVARVVGHENHLVDGTGVNLQLIGLGVKIPDHVDGIGRHELHPHLTARVHDLGAFVLPTGLAIDAEGLAHHVVQRHQSEPEGEHHHRQRQQAPNQAFD